MFDIDYVFPWVNDQDPVWQKIYKDYCKTHGYKDKVKGAHNCRYRDWGLLKYLFRCIAKNMPWIRKVHLIVSNIEQVPDWINTEEVHVVLHQDFMPSEVLPTFNSTTIEMFLPNIPDLAEHFIYGNDDIFPWNPSEPTDWFTEEGLPCQQMRVCKRYYGEKQFTNVCQNEWWELQTLITGKAEKSTYMRPWHCAAPMVKSKCIETINLLNYNNILKRCSPFRIEENYNQYIYSNYMYLIDYTSVTPLTFEYIDFKDFNLVYRRLQNNHNQVICLNDSGKMQNTAPSVMSILITRIIDPHLPNKSKYEK